MLQDKFNDLVLGNDLYYHKLELKRLADKGMDLRSFKFVKGKRSELDFEHSYEIDYNIDYAYGLDPRALKSG